MSSHSGRIQNKAEGRRRSWEKQVLQNRKSVILERTLRSLLNGEGVARCRAGCDGFACEAGHVSWCLDSRDVHLSASSLCPFPIWSHTLILKQLSAAALPTFPTFSPTRLSNIELNHFLAFRKETPSREMPPSSPPPPVLSNKSRR